MNDTVARALRESEELHRITLLNMSDSVLITDDDGVFTYVCPNVDVICGHDQGSVQALGHISRLLGRELVDRARLTAEGEIRNIEHEIETKDGSCRSLLVHIKQVAIKGGTTLYVCRDITERKQSELALRRNEERLTLALEAANMGMWEQVLRLTDQATEIGAELHRLSHELHPARLRQLGLEVSLRSLGEEVADAHGIGVDVDVPATPSAVTPDIALNVYRVAQEALQNVVKHSRAAHVVVRLSQSDSDVILSVTDDGIGFDQNQTRATSTMGLVSMRERARLVLGQLTITSQPGRGTNVSLRARTTAR